jgi:hypothetical protein
MVLLMKTNTSPALPGEVQAYVHLQRQIHDALRKEHPEWVEPNGESPMCDSYEARLAEQLDTFTRRGSNGRKGDFPSQ